MNYWTSELIFTAKNVLEWFPEQIYSLYARHNRSGRQVGFKNLVIIYLPE